MAYAKRPCHSICLLCTLAAGETGLDPVVPVSVRITQILHTDMGTNNVAGGETEEVENSPQVAWEVDCPEPW